MASMLIQPSCKQIYAIHHKDHYCYCGKFKVKYEIIKDDGSSDGEKDFGAVDVSGCGDIYDKATGKKLLISKDKCFTKIILRAEGNTPPSTKAYCEGPSKKTCQEKEGSGAGNSHDGLDIKFTDSDGTELGEVSYSTRQPAEITYCEIFNQIAGAP